ncbi:MAG: PQQ-dependent sugar dehydrogenase [Pseudomonadota bacterium]
MRPRSNRLAALKFQIDRLEHRVERIGHAALGIIVFVLVLGSLMIPAVSAAERVNSQSGPIIVETVAEGLNHPWGLAFLPEGGMLVTERDGTIRLVTPEGGVSAPLAGGPQTEGWGQGGLLDIVIDPEFETSGRLYFSYAGVDGRRAGTAIAHARIVRDSNGARLESLTEIFRMNQLSRGTRHFGSRIVFAEDGTLWFTVGDRGDPDRAQDPNDHAGSVLRIDRDGGIPSDNPFRNIEGAQPELWSIGHRNAQGAVRHPETGALWTISHGARGGDEINIPRPGLNYGWPVISYGRHYSGFSIGEGTEKAGLEQPIYYWDPSIAPSGAAFYTGDVFPQWKGNLFVGALKNRLLSRLTLDGEEVTGEELLLSELGERIRDVRQGPDGHIYLLTDSPNGRILRLSPAS